MKKAAILLLAIIMVFALTACSSAPVSSSTPEVVHITVTPKPTPEPTTTPEPENTDEMLVKQIDEYFSMTKQQIIEKEGSNYEEVFAGAEGSMEGLEYASLGLTFAFYEDTLLELIECDPKFKIYGAGSGMSFSEIMEHLGEAEIKDTWVETPDHPAFVIEYQLGNCIYMFLSFESDGSDSWLSIRNAGPGSLFEDESTPKAGNETKIDYNKAYDALITEWKSALNYFKSNGYTEDNMLDFSFYNGSGDADSAEAYYALYDIDGNGIKELILNKRTENEDIIAYIFTIKDGKPINAFGYTDEDSPVAPKGSPIEVPWSRVGSSGILSNGLIDCTDGDYSIYKFSDDGYSVISIASSEPYDYPDEASKAEAKWRYYINDKVVDYDSYVRYLKTQGYKLNGKNPLAVIDWINID